MAPLAQKSWVAAGLLPQTRLHIGRQLMRMQTRALLAFVLSLGAYSASCAEPLGHEVKVNPVLRGGELVGCGIEYVASIADRTYRAGDVSGIIGSVTLLEHTAGRAPVMFFKLHGMDVGPDGKLHPFHVAQAHVLVGSSSVAKGSPAQCENTLGRCTVHSVDDWLKVAERVVVSDRLTVSYNRKLDGLSVLVDMSVNKMAALALSNCMEEYVKQAGERAQHSQD